MNAAPPKHHLQPTREQFLARAKPCSVVPVSREILADLDTPLSAYLKVEAEHPEVFLLESVEGGEKWARFSFLGFGGGRAVIADGDGVRVLDGKTVISDEPGAQPFDVLRRELDRYEAIPDASLPRFSGGWVGYLSYDIVRNFERLPDSNPDELGFPALHLVRTDRLLVFDNVRGTIRVLRNVFLDEHTDAGRAYDDAVVEIDEWVAKLRRAQPEPEPRPASSEEDRGWTTNFTAEGYEAVVQRAKEYVKSGDVIQVVPSQRFTTVADVPCLELYRALRVVNPSPYMFLMRLEEGTLIGSSPEILLRVEGDHAITRPIAGTRPRAFSDAEDRALEKDLLSDPKELAEHVMLVDLGRNDLGRVARTGTVNVPQYAVVERYSHVMHIVSDVEARLRDDTDGLAALRSTFPAGTLTGAPKIRAMEIIDELEPVRRGPYGGAVGWISFAGDLDFCITIRTMMVTGGKIHLQAGGGVVADSDPRREYEETINKARALRRAVELARGGLDDLSIIDGVPRRARASGG